LVEDVFDVRAYDDFRAEANEAEGGDRSQAPSFRAIPARLILSGAGLEAERPCPTRS
jgi:hypothetical protein